MIKAVFALMHGATVETIAEKWKLRKPAKPFPARMRRAIVQAMAAMHWLCLSDWFPCRGLAAVVFRTCNLPREVTGSRVGDDVTRRKLLLLYAFICRTKYPATADAFPAWNEVIGKALREVTPPFPPSPPHPQSRA